MLHYDVLGDGIQCILDINLTWLEKIPLKWDFASSICAGLHACHMISKAPLMSLANVWILTSMEGIEEVQETWQYTNPTDDCVVFLKLY